MSNKVIQAKFVNFDMPSAIMVRRLPSALRVGAHGKESTALIQKQAGVNDFALDIGKVKFANRFGTPLPQSTRAHMETVFGVDFSDVRIHIGNQAEQIGAVAFTMGSDIFFAPGQFQPETKLGMQLLGHELTHVVQQRNGSARNPRGIGVAIVDDSRLEAEADLMGQRASLQGIAPPASVMGCPATALTGSANSVAIQRKTAVTFATKVKRRGDDQITALNHSRGMHWGTHKNLAAYLSGYANFASATYYTKGVCNHYISYKMVADAVEHKILGMSDLDEVADWLEGLDLPDSEEYSCSEFGLPGKWKFSVGAMPDPDVKRNKIGGVYYYSEKNLNQEIDDLIFNIANDPRNLFYWNKTTGDNHGANYDLPVGNGNGYADRDDVVDRLKNYRKDIKALGLPLP